MQIHRQMLKRVCASALKLPEALRKNHFEHPQH